MPPSYEDIVDQLRHPGVSRCILDMYREMNVDYASSEEQEGRDDDQD